MKDGCATSDSTFKRGVKSHSNYTNVNTISPRNLTWPGRYATWAFEALEIEIFCVATAHAAEKDAHDKLFKKMSKEMEDKSWYKFNGKVHYVTNPE